MWLEDELRNVEDLADASFWVTEAGQWQERGRLKW